jgi:uncharacterized protein (TIGR03067 family)
MRRTFAFLGLLAALLVSTSLAPSVRAADEPDDQKLLAGTWKPLEANLGGNVIDQMLLDKARVVYAGDKYTITIDDKKEEGVFKLDATKMPKEMDIFPTSGDNNGKTFFAVYKLDGDSLTICYSLTEGVRPEDFQPISNTLITVKYEREKPE